LALEISKSKMNLPTFLLKGALALIKPIIQKKAGFSLDDINVMGRLESCTMPALFVTSENDSLVNSTHAKSIFEHY